ncbi:NB-ARC domain-containing protein [Kocuria sabuli]|uniref:NB-ARC domain-containing protein n=1 Tax=Kocuria sabuli TaxID=3071448 RepID=UPI0034D4DB3E
MGVPLNRVVAVVTTFSNGDEQVGSGFLVEAGKVLTAEHCTRHKSTDEPAAIVEIVRATDSARVLSGTITASRVLDVAVLEVPNPPWREESFPPVAFARVDRSQSTMLQDCEGIGFPTFQVDPQGVFRTSEFHGTTYVTDEAKSGHLLVREDRIRPGAPVAIPPPQQHGRFLSATPPQDSSATGDEWRPWGGFSGTLLFYGQQAIGVVVEHHPRQGEAALRARTIDALVEASEKDHVAELIARLLNLKSLDDLQWAVKDTGRQADDVGSKVALQTLGSATVPILRSGGIVGRESLLDSIETQILSDTNVALLSGLPGVGKTALAVSAARDPRMTNAFPDGQLWLSVGRQGPSGLSHWVHRMATWAQLLGVPADKRDTALSTENGKYMVSLIHEALADARCLLVFDDVWLEDDAGHFGGLGAKCGRLLTTRIPAVALGFSPAPTKVPELDEDSSRALLELYCPGATGKFGERLDRVLQAIGGVPLSLILVGKGLKERLMVMGSGAASKFLDDVLKADKRLELMVDKLPPAERPLLEGTNRTLQAVIELTASNLKPAERESLRALTVFPPKANTFGIEAGVFVSGGEEAFSAIPANGLIELMDEDNSRFAMHQAIADFARRGSEGDPTAYRRMVEYFIDQLDTKFREEDGTTWVETLKPEGENLRAALEWTIAAGETTLGIKLMTSLWPYWYRQSLFQRARDLADRMLALPQPSASTREEQLMRAKLLNDNGNYAYNMADLQSAEAAHRESLRIRQKLGEEDLTAGSLNNLALVMRERGHYEEAMEGFTAARGINEQHRHKLWRLWLGMNLNNIGITQYRQGQYEAAQSSQAEAAAAFKSAKDDWGVAMARADSAFCLIRLGHLDEALHLTTDLLSDRWSIRDDKAVATVLRACALLASARNQHDLAKRALLAAIALSEPVTDRLGEGKALEQLVIVLHESGELDAASTALGALQAYYRKTGIVPAPIIKDEIDRAVRELARDGAPHKVHFDNSFHQLVDSWTNLRATLRADSSVYPSEAVVLELLSAR